MTPNIERIRAQLASHPDHSVAGAVLRLTQQFGAGPVLVSDCIHLEVTLLNPPPKGKILPRGWVPSLQVTAHFRDQAGVTLSKMLGDRVEPGDEVVLKGFVTVTGLEIAPL